jgi:hypothetical protein
MKEEPTIEELERDIKEREFLLGFKRFIDQYNYTKKTNIHLYVDLFYPNKRKDLYLQTGESSMYIPLSDITKEFADDLISLLNKHKSSLMSAEAKVEIKRLS